MKTVNREIPAENCADALRAAIRLRWPCSMYFRPLPGKNRQLQPVIDVKVTAGDGDYNVFPCAPWERDGKLLTGKQYSDELQYRIRVAAF